MTCSLSLKTNYLNKHKSLTFERLNLPFFIARRYLAHQKGTFASITRLSVLASALSITVMIISLAVVTGFTYQVKQKLYSFNGHVHVSSFDLARSVSINSTPIYLDKKLMQQMRQIPHVVQVSPFVQVPVIVQAKGHMEGIKLKGVNSDYHFSSAISISGKNIDYSDTNYSRQILLSEGTARKLDVYSGDTVQVEFLNDNGMPRIRKVRVAGLYHSGLEDVDKYFGVCDIRMLQHINQWTADSINAYQLDLSNEQFADTVSNFIHYNLVIPPLESTTTNENNDSLLDWLNLQSMNSTIILIIMAIVSIINMGAVILILMVDRANMIGLLKALGMPFKEMVKVFLAVGGIIGGAGILLGNILALGLCWLQLHFGLVKLPEETYFMKYAPVKLVWWHVVLTDVGSLVLFLVCMLLPALYIRTIQPAKVLQFK